jgi:WbqC-like protein
MHQPTFLPWLGYFDKIRRADVFVFLDRVNYQKSGSSMASWCNRVAIRINGAAAWISCPVVREHGPQIIDTVRIDERRPWRDELRAVIERNYRKAPRFQPAFELIDGLLRYESDYLADFNINAIRAIARRLGCEADYLRQSALPPVEQKATERLVAICRQLGADTYVSGDGSGDYLDQDAFVRAGVRLAFQNFMPLPYGDPTTYIPGLSAIDWLMHALPGDMKNETL